MLSNRAEQGAQNEVAIAVRKSDHAVDLACNRLRFLKRNVRQLRYSCKPIGLEPSSERLVLTKRERHPV